MADVSIISKLFVCLMALHYTVSQDSHFCDMKQKKNAECPEELDILYEYSKNDSEWKIDFEQFRLEKISHTTDLIKEISNRKLSGKLCPYTRIHKQCCEGYSGADCKIANSAVPIPMKNLTRPAYLPFSTCLLWGKDHYRTFDGSFFQLSGNCDYKLSGASSWQVNVKTEGCQNYNTCKKTLLMSFGSIKINANGGKITIDQESLGDEENYVKDALTIERKEEFVHLRFSDGVRLKWTTDSLTIFLTVDDQYVNKVSGLCGDYNDEKENDFLLPTGEYTKEASIFANSWRLDSSCSEVPPITYPCNTPELKIEAKEACKLIIDPNDVFNLCDKVLNGSKYFDECEKDYCVAKRSSDPKSVDIALCNAFALFGSQCSDHFITVEWRTATRCPKQCSGKKVYSECGTSCPKTCQNRNINLSGVQCIQACSPGCVCPAGLYIDAGQNNTCVESQECTCFYRGNYYRPNEKVTIDCNECTCQSGLWSCTKRKCPRTCSLYGLGHFKTFDGKNYDFRGNCEYTLLEQTNTTADPNLLITYKSVNALNKENPIELNIHAMSTIVSIRQNLIYVNSQVTSSLPFVNSDVFVKKTSEFFYSIQGKGFWVLFDGIRVYITVDPLYLDNIRGLCGTYNFKSSDDFMPPNGFIESDIISFVDSYKLDGSCQTPKQMLPCDTYPSAVSDANSMCDVLKSALFKPCESLVDVATFIEACKFDICSDENSNQRDMYRCRAVAAYAHECASKGVVIDWLENDDLRELKTACYNSKYGKCFGGSKYSECTKLANSTCKELFIRDKFVGQNEFCVAGCSCPDGQFLDKINGQYMCVVKESCSCYDLVQNKYYQPGEKIQRACSTCTCSNGSWSCDSTDCRDIIKCPQNQVFSNKASSCPKTCANKDHYRDCNIEIEGCICPNGTIPDFNNVCVPEIRCPCHHGGKNYNHMETIRMGCNTCECRGGHWTCSTEKCDGVCIAAGDPHYSTYDGLRFSYQGNCKYILTQTSDQSFRVIAENIPCGTTGVTCTKNIFIQYNEISISLMRGRNIEVNGIEIVDLDEGARVFGSVRIMTAGLYHIINSTDFMIKWDEATRLYIVIHSHWKNKMQGICGNFDMDSSNDMQTTSGILGTLEEFVDSWKVEKSCPLRPSPIIDESDPCSGHLHRKEWAIKECSLVNTPGAGNPFTPCLAKLDPADIQKSHIECLFDACSCDKGGDCECLCSSLASFAELCLKVGVAVKWRTQHRCPIQCEYGKEYLPCGPLCQQTCMDLSTGNNPQCPDAGCVEGCFCPEGYVIDYNGKCVLPTNCDCYANANRYPPGSQIAKDCEICVCINGTFVCDEKILDCKTECNKETEFSCKADKTCLPLDWLCDKTVDCSDSSDEADCKCELNNSTFVCDNGQCINSIKVCDGIENCRDQSDERDCYNPICEEFLCQNKKCIPHKWVCDGYNDCGIQDDSDEINCNNTNICEDEVREFYCESTNPTCHPIAQLCDGHDDCGDGSDESNCTCICENAFSCKNLCECIDTKKVCDSKKDCSDGSDEINCGCQEDEYRCIGGKCINSTKLCDGIEDCVKGDDENHPNCTFCEHIQILGNSQYVSAIETSPYIFPENLIPGNGGANFTSLPVTITIEMVPGLSVEIRETVFINENTNVAEYVAYLYNVDNDLVEVKTSENVLEPLAFVNGVNITKVVIEIRETIDNQAPTFVEMAINACDKGLTTFTSTTTTTTTTKQTTEPKVTQETNAPTIFSPLLSTISSSEFFVTSSSLPSAFPSVISSTVESDILTTQTANNFTCLNHNNATIANQIIKNRLVENITFYDLLDISSGSRLNGFSLASYSSFSIEIVFNINVTITNIFLSSTEHIQVSFSADDRTIENFVERNISDAFIYSISVDQFFFANNLKIHVSSTDKNPVIWGLLIENCNFYSFAGSPEPSSTRTTRIRTPRTRITTTIPKTSVESITSETGTTEEIIEQSTDTTTTTTKQTTEPKVTQETNAPSTTTTPLMTIFKTGALTTESIESSLAFSSHFPSTSLSPFTTSRPVLTSSSFCLNQDILHHSYLIESINNQANEILSKNVISDFNSFGWSPQKFSDYIDFKFLNPIQLFRIEVVNGSNVHQYILQLLDENSDQTQKMIFVEPQSSSFYFSSNLPLIRSIRFKPFEKLSPDLDYNIRLRIFACIDNTTSLSPVCVLSEWSQWTVCSSVCGNTTRSRIRTALKGVCNETLNEEETCINPDCSCVIDRETYLENISSELPFDLLVGYIFNNQSEYSEEIFIDDSIPLSTKIRSDPCTEFECTLNGLVKTSFNCTEFCQYDAWSEWTDCDATCENSGIQYRTKNLNNSNPFCNSTVTDSQICIKDCICLYTEWEQWSPCTKTCGSGETRRIRKIKTLHLIAYCNETLEEIDVCNTNCCPIDGEYSSWSQWSECSLTCGSGIRRRTRSCDSPPPDCNGKQCEGSENEIESCNTEPCEPYCEEGKEYNNCSNKCDLTCSTLSCSLVCHEPDTCTPGCTCPSGTVENEKNECVSIEKCLCPYEDQIFLPGQIYEKECETCKCVSGCMECLPKNCSKCELSEWTEWSNCTKQCGGISKRFRSYYGINCDRNDTIEEVKKCEQCNCTINNITYTDGEVFANLENKCEECKCIAGKVICLPKCNETEETCREKSDEQYIFTFLYPIGENCCGTCIKIPRVNNTCQVIKLKPEFIQTGGCISENMLPREVCSGSCPSYEKSYVRFPGLANNAKSCKCCSADKTYTQNVIMRCPDRRIQAEYIRLASCKCEICGAS